MFFLFFRRLVFFFFFFNDTATTEIYTLSLHDALPISWRLRRVSFSAVRSRAVSGISRAKVWTSSCTWSRDSGNGRSEEHTSELQSLAYLVCRLLLEKKKRKHISKSENNIYARWLPMPS